MRKFDGNTNTDNAEELDVKYREIIAAASEFKKRKVRKYLLRSRKRMLAGGIRDRHATVVDLSIKRILIINSLLIF